MTSTLQCHLTILSSSKAECRKLGVLEKFQSHSAWFGGSVFLMIGDFPLQFSSHKFQVCFFFLWEVSRHLRRGRSEIVSLDMLKMRICLHFLNGRGRNGNNCTTTTLESKNSKCLAFFRLKPKCDLFLKFHPLF